MNDPASGETGSDSNHPESFLVPGITVALLAAGILFYSQTPSLDWDEGFHLLAAFLIKTGKRPYVDFIFPQPMLNAEWNALWLRIFGESWRAIHAVAGVLTAASVWLTAEFTFTRVRLPHWRAPAASAAALFVGLNGIVLEFGPKGQAYGTCLFLTVAAFRLTVAAPGKRSAWTALAAGLFAGAAAACTLLTAPACPVLLVWLAVKNREGHRAGKAAAFVAGMAIPVIPVLLAFATSPHLTWFNLVEYHARYRFVQWGEVLRNDLEVLASWVDSGQALLLGLFAVAGLVWLRKSGWSPLRKAEFSLAAWIAIALSAEAAIAHPTFAQYFVFLVPFLAIPAALGIAVVFSRFDVPRVAALGVLAVILGLSLANSIDQFNQDNATWVTLEKMARKVADVTPARAEILADPHIYFLLHRVPPAGAEFPASHRVELPHAQAAALHIMPQSEMEKLAKGGAFATVETCYSDLVEKLQLQENFAHKQEFGTCGVYWEFKGRR